MRATGTQQTLHQDEVFVELVLGDDGLVRAEFDALIAACWESPCEPPRRRHCPPVGAWAPWPQPRLARAPGVPCNPVPPRRPDGRQRGPPQDN